MGISGIICEVIVLGACICALISNVLLLQSCDLLDLEDRDNANRSGSMGLFEWKLPGQHKQCVILSEIENRAVTDWALKTARISSILSLAFGVIILVYGVFKQCLCPLPCTQLLMDLSSTGVTICLALIYLLWFSDYCRELYECSYGNGFWFLVATQVFWLLVGCFSRCMRPGRSERRDD